MIEGRKGERGRRELELYLDEAEIDTVSVTARQAEIACEAFRRYGKGRHPAALNIGDCFAYALAHVMDERLLYKGGDFARTDINPVA